MKISDEILLSSLFNRFTKYLNDNNSAIVFKYENNKIKYFTKGLHDKWYDWYDKWYYWYDKCEPIKDIDFKDERLNFLIGKEDSFFNCLFFDERKYDVVNKCINFLHNPVSLEDLAIKMDLMGI